MGKDLDIIQAVKDNDHATLQKLFQKASKAAGKNSEYFLYYYERIIITNSRPKKYAKYIEIEKLL